MGNEEQLVMKLQTKPAVLGKHMVPFCCLPPWTMGAEFLTKCKIGRLGTHWDGGCIICLV